MRSHKLFCHGALCGNLITTVYLSSYISFMEEQTTAAGIILISQLLKSNRMSDGDWCWNFVEQVQWRALFSKWTINYNRHTSEQIQLLKE